MKTIVVLSDSHRNVAAIEKIREIMAESDYIIHLGDNAIDMKSFYSDFGDKIYQVDGNCDPGSGVKEQILNIENRRVFFTHGDLYGVKSGKDRIFERAKELKADVVLYGHTHTADVEEREGVLMVNPGCITEYSSEKSFCYLVINNNKAVATINNRIFL